MCRLCFHYGNRDNPKDVADIYDLLNGLHNIGEVTLHVTQSLLDKCKDYSDDDKMNKMPFLWCFNIDEFDPSDLQD